MASAPLLSAHAQSKPKFIVYMSDDYGKLFSEPYGATAVHTPHLARLAGEGMRFTHAFNTSPSCGPSRTSMLTGLWPARHGAELNHKPPKPEAVGLPAVLKWPTATGRNTTTSMSSTTRTLVLQTPTRWSSFLPSATRRNRCACSLARTIRMCRGSRTKATMPRR